LQILQTKLFDENKAKSVDSVYVVLQIAAMILFHYLKMLAVCLNLLSKFCHAKKLTTGDFSGLPIPVTIQKAFN
jgi:hypothetical protein